MIEKFQRFQTNIEGIALPERFTFPFYYTPHPLARIAAEELQSYIETQTDFDHNFGLDPSDPRMPIGKMFGVLVVQNATGQIGYLAGVSGKLAESNHHKMFVPTIFDTLDEGDFYKKGEAIVNQFNAEIEQLESSEDYHVRKEKLNELKREAEKSIEALRQKSIELKKIRKQKRTEKKSTLDEKAYASLLEELGKESVYYHFLVKDNKRKWNEQIASQQASVNEYADRIASLKQERKELSNELQNKIFDQYTFLNSRGEMKSLRAIFADTFFKIPPAGAGECAAPKLLHYAFDHNLKPIALAEFWWGVPPKAEIRKHKNYYPCCRGKCEPILGHMLQGMSIDDNPMLTVETEPKEIITLYEDDYMLVIHKPHEFLSVPGIHIKDSVQTRMKKAYPDATGPMIVHRLDMSTSGLMLIAKSLEMYKILQRQFIKRDIEKRYEALLDGEVADDTGFIDLPLRVDLEDRPCQLVCYEHGKNARTRWEVVDRKDGKTRVHLYPITGRTHQLRVHAAHTEGLHTPIIGDDLYGVKGERLHLHAAYLKFKHPKTGELIEIEREADF